MQFDPQVDGAGRVTAAAAIAAVAAFLPWHSVDMGELKVSASGLDVGPGVGALVGAIGAALVTWAERTGAIPLQRSMLLMGALVGAGFSALMYAVHWNDTRNPIFGAFVGTTPWFYAGLVAAVAATWFSFRRVRDWAAAKPD